MDTFRIGSPPVTRSNIVAKKLPSTKADQIASERLKNKFLELKEKEPDVTQASFARDCGMKPPAVSRMMSGDIAISKDAAMVFARRLFCHPSEFHPDFVDFTAAESYWHAELYHHFESLSDEEQRSVAHIIDSLYRKNQRAD